LGQVATSRDNRLHSRLDAISAGLRAIRLVDAAQRWASGVPFTETDRATIRTVAEDLRNEVRILRNQDAPDVTDETAFAFATLALQALPRTSSEIDSAVAADQLEYLANDLDSMLDSKSPDQVKAKRIETVFLRTSDLVNSTFGSTGEQIDDADDLHLKQHV
jgi:hypothetical protein